MNDSPRNSFSFETSVDLESQFINDTSSGSIALLFSHNYYSTDSAYGSSVLKNFIHSIVHYSDKKLVLLFSDKATLLLSDIDLLNDLILLSENNCLYVLSSSVDEYEVTVLEDIATVLVSDSEFINLILEFNPIRI